MLKRMSFLKKIKPGAREFVVLKHLIAILKFHEVDGDDLVKRKQSLSHLLNLN